MIRIEIPVRTTNPLNGSQGRTRGGMFARSRHRKMLRELTRLHMCAWCPLDHWQALMDDGTKPVTVTLTRIAPRPLDDDGWQAAAKSIRDAVAGTLGVKDNSTRVVWRYAQSRGRPKTYSVVITVEAAD